MSGARPLVKVASEEWEFAEIHRLNHQTFVEEIRQHPPGPADTLVDRFHRENVYVVAVERRSITGMLAVRSARPFSLDSKLPDLDSYLPPKRHVCELRLLAVAPQPGRQGRLLPFHRGPFRVAADAGRPVVPIVLSGTRHILESSLRRLRRGRIVVAIGEPFHPAGADRHDIDELRERTRQHVASGLDAAR